MCPSMCVHYVDTGRPAVAGEGTRTGTLVLTISFVTPLLVGNRRWGHLHVTSGTHVY